MFCLLFQFVSTHLQFLQYTLQEGALYLPWSRARDIWGTLIANTDACTWDREVGSLGVHVTSLQQEVYSLGIHITGLTHEVGSLGVHITGLQHEVYSLGVHIMGLQQEVYSLGIHVTGLQHEVYSLGVHITGLQHEVGSLGVHITGLQQEVYSLGVHITGLQHEVYSLGVHITGLQHEVYSLGIHVTSLQDRGNCSNPAQEHEHRISQHIHYDFGESDSTILMFKWADLAGTTFCNVLACTGKLKCISVMVDCTLYFQTCFEWFSRGLPDLEMDTQTQLFQKELLKLDPAKLTDKG